MSPLSDERLIERIHASGKPFVLAASGGGSGAMAALLTTPGASAVVLEAALPYSERALAHWLGGPVEQACSERTARAMAMAAFERARRLSDAAPRALGGIGATASLATSRPKRGPHRIHIAWQSAERTAVVSCELAKGQRTRAEEEKVAARLLLGAVAESCGVASGCLIEPSSNEPLLRREKCAPAEWTELLLGERQLVSRRASGLDDRPASQRTIFPGAFNPFHAGHRQMAELAAGRYGMPVELEISLTNVEKPPLDFIELDDRLRQLAGHDVLLTAAPTFAEKACLLPRAVFLVGVDTLVRIADRRYYDGDAGRRDAAIAAIAEHGCRFLVFGRLLEGRFCTLSNVELVPALRELCDEVPPSAFRADISSTALRSGRSSGGRP